MGLKYSVQTLIQEATFPFWFVPMCHAKCQARLEPGHGVHGAVLWTGAQKESSEEGFFLGALGFLQPPVGFSSGSRAARENLTIGLHILR